jgi:ribonuclease VapC
MVIDSSALLAIVFGESDSDLYANAIETRLESGGPLRLPASVLVEAHIAAESRKGEYGKRLAALIDGIQPDIIPLTVAVANRAIVAFRSFGKGVHKAGLNFGDCMSYATAKDLKEPLLFKGRDFSHTDVRSVLPKLL